MTKSEARELLDEYFKEHKCPINDAVFKLPASQAEYTDKILPPHSFKFSEITFRGLLMIAYDLKEDRVNLNV